MTDQSAILPGKQATTTWEPAKGGDTDTAPRRVACQELIGENGKAFVRDSLRFFAYVLLDMYKRRKESKNELINKGECES